MKRIRCSSRDQSHHLVQLLATGRIFAARRSLRSGGFRFILAALLAAVSLSASALPTDLSKYQVIKGGLSDIRDGAAVEGSARQGGVQPDYIIDLQSEPLKSFLERAKVVGESDLTYWDKVGTIVEMVKGDFFRYSDYNNPYYRRLMKRFRDRGEDIPLSRYGVCRAGVCRENALVLHFALKAAGIPNLHGYAHIHRSSKWDNFSLTEDHAFTVIHHEGEDWVVDSYYWGFNGFRLKDLTSPGGITETSPASPIAAPRRGTRGILEINKFPRIFNPLPGVVRCNSALIG